MRVEAGESLAAQPGTVGRPERSSNQDATDEGSP
jgi:hypothetical protein